METSLAPKTPDYWRGVAFASGIYARAHIRDASESTKLDVLQREAWNLGFLAKHVDQQKVIGDIFAAARAKFTPAEFDDDALEAYIGTYFSHARVPDADKRTATLKPRPLIGN